ncbi:unnamed protein product [Arabis nemorensis]|uniref:Uncharacterized protein n=1 Tax=Arabis nemorensis TaxID=586526 RepID=A0A565CNN5_9BRAS|nr:unnamed protein product [Arabis nemorensis]
MAEEEVADAGSEEDSAAYDLSFNFKAKDHIASIPHTCAELYSKIPCCTVYTIPEPDDLIEREAYQLFTESVMEMLTQENLIIKNYDRRSRGLLKKLEDYPSKVAAQITALNDLSKKARKARERETAPLRSSRRHEVNQIIAKCDAKLLRIKKSILDNEEANRHGGLMNQTMAIKDYLAGFKNQTFDGFYLCISRSFYLSATLRSAYDGILYVAKCARMTRLRILRRLESVAGLASAYRSLVEV